MRNLILKQIHNESLKSLSPSLEDINNKILLTSLDESSNTIIIFTSDLKIFLIEYSFLSPSIIKNEIELDSSLCDYSDLMLSLMDQLEKKENPFIYIYYKSEIETIILVLKSGEIFNIPINEQKSKLIINLCNKQINNAIIAIEISPNQEYIIAVLSNFKIIVLSYDTLNKINECDLDDGDLSDISKDNYICKKANISFKSTGDLFGIAYTINDGVKCMVRDSLLKLIKGPGRADDNIVFSVGEKPLKKLEPILSFMPSGSLIAFFDKENNKIIFSEKNCLCHGEFDIILDKNTIKNISKMKFIKWNLDKPMILLVFEAQLNDNNEKNEFIQIYFRSNYEWTLKYEIIKKNDLKILNCIFSDFTRDQVIIIYNDKSIEFINFELEYTSSLHYGNNFNNNYGEICTVYNNNKIRYTPLGIVNIPPPMALAILDNNKGNKYLWYNNYFFSFNNKTDNKYIIQVFETQCRTMNYIYDLNIIFNNDNHDAFDLNYIKKIIFVPLFKQNSGVFILNEIHKNELLNEYLIFISFDNIEYKNNNGNIINFNNKNCINYKKIKISNYNSGIIFNSVKFNNSYEKEYFDENNILSHAPSLVKQNLNEMNKKIKNKKESDLLTEALNKNKNDTKNMINFNLNIEKGLSGLSGNSLGQNSLGQNSLEKIENENENEEEYKIYFYFTGYNTKTKEQTFHKLWYNIKSQNISDINNLENDDNNLSNIFHDPKKNGRIVQIYSSLSYKNIEIIIYLTHNNYLYENGTLLGTEINSFIIFKHFLLFTQLSSSPYSTLHLIDLNDEKTIENFKKLSVGKNTNLLYKQNLNYKDFYMRTLERGSIIVTCSGIKTILQMPIGNLETIMPRIIVLDEIKKDILNKKYENAFLLCRKNKINLNLIYDIEPKSFIDNLSLFIQEVKKEDYLNLFLNSLIDDYCEEFKILFNYKQSLNSIKNINNENKNKINYDTKTNKICLAIRKLLLTDNFKENNDYLTTILITYIKQNPPMYLEALKLVQKLKIEKKNEKADKALEFLCWIVKADTLFDFALITYDFELVIMVAKHTQKDPKEYLKYLHELEELKKVDPIKMKYQINIDQKNYIGALKELSKGGDKYFDKALELIKEHNLYDEALSLYNSPLNEIFYAKIYENKGDYLSNLPNNDKRKNNNLAAMCYFRSRNYKKAFKLFCSLGKVIEVLSLLNEIDINDLNKDLYTILIELLDVIKEKGTKYEIEKYYLYLVNNKIWEKLSPNEFCEIINKLIELMVDFKIYNMSYFATINIMRLIKDDNKLSDLLSGLVKLLNDNLSLQYELNYNLLKKNLLDFKEKYNRLLIVQEIKKEHPEVYELDINKDEEIDNVSDSGSVVSGSSKKSGKSSSSRMSKSKKGKKKNMRRNVKEGSPMEEEFLIENLKELKIEDGFIKEMNELSDVLMMSKMNNKSEELRSMINEYINEVNYKTKKLFLYKQIKYVNEHPEICDLFPNFELNTILFPDNEKNENIINIKQEHKK